MSVTSHPLPDTHRSHAVTRFAATAAAATLALGLSAAPAAADGVQGTYPNHPEHGGGKAEGGTNVWMDDGGEDGPDEISTSLFKLDLDDSDTLKMYCIDYHTNIQDMARYEENDWADYPGRGDFSEPAKVHWVLQHGYPQAAPSELAKVSDAGKVTRSQALAATQAAIWHFSNDVDLAANKLDSDDKVIAKVYDYLTGEAEELPQPPSEPDVSLRISPESAEGKADSVIGEFTLETTADSVPLELDGPEGAQLVDLSTGEPITDPVSTGSEFGVMIPEGTPAGKATVSASVSATMNFGRLFMGIDREGKKPTQTLITAQKQTAPVSVGAEVSWKAGDKPTPTPTPSDSGSPSPSPSPTETPDDKPTPSETPSTPPEDDEDDDNADGGLPVTGAALGGLVAAAVAALGAGAAVMFLSRKRRSSSIG